MTKPKLIPPNPAAVKKALAAHREKEAAKLARKTARNLARRKRYKELHPPPQAGTQNSGAGSRSGLLCPLCGLTVQYGKMLEHKKTEHGEAVVKRKPVTENPKAVWVKVYQGGLPSLGKRSK